MSEIRSMLAAHGLRPNKSLGQNFLIDHAKLGALCDAARVGDGSCVLEVGPGTGTLTETLLERGARVVACELDRGLAGLLTERFAEQIDAGRLVLVVGDCLAGKHAVSGDLLAAVDAAFGGDQAYSLVANLPYGAGTPLLMALLLQHARCESMSVTVQEEVADRLCAGADAVGTDTYGVLGVAVGLTAVAERVATLPPGCFWPPPSIRSAMVRLVRRADGLPMDEVNEAVGLARRLFTQRRKKLRAAAKSLKITLPELEELGLDPDVRVSAVAPESWAALAAGAVS